MLQANMSFWPPAWTRENMLLQDYLKLPWPEKKRILLRHGWAFPLAEACSACGNLPPKPVPLSGSFLLDAYFKEQADLHHQNKGGTR